MKEVSDLGLCRPREKCVREPGFHASGSATLVDPEPEFTRAYTMLDPERAWNPAGRETSIPDERLPRPPWVASCQRGC